MLDLQFMRPGLALTLAMLMFMAFASTGWSGERSRIGNHLLMGRVWDVSAGVFVQPGTVIEEAHRADLVILGEQHWNREHHALQASLLRSMVAAGRRPAVVFEMIAEDRQSALDRYLLAHAGDVIGIGSAIGWAETGWPPWSYYQAIAEVALEAGLPLRAGNISERLLTGVREHGFSAVDEKRRHRLGLDRQLSERALLAMRSELTETHRGLVSDAALGTLVTVQQARNAILADNLSQALALEDVDAAALITGEGHARLDRGVPVYLSPLVGDKRTLVIAFLEVAEDLIIPEAYFERFEGSPPFDFIWFTRRSNQAVRLAH